MEQASASEVLATGGLCSGGCAVQGAVQRQLRVRCSAGGWCRVDDEGASRGWRARGKAIYFHRVSSEKVAGAVCEG
eukprot:scaffold74103_cov60-Phaeocystis_antarctica.AAC.2